MNTLLHFSPPSKGNCRWGSMTCHQTWRGLAPCPSTTLPLTTPMWLRPSPTTTPSPPQVIYPQPPAITFTLVILRVFPVPSLNFCPNKQYSANFCWYHWDESVQYPPVGIQLFDVMQDSIEKFSFSLFPHFPNISSLFFLVIMIISYTFIFMFLLCPSLYLKDSSTCKSFITKQVISYLIF